MEADVIDVFNHKENQKQTEVSVVYSEYEYYEYKVKELSTIVKNLTQERNNVLHDYLDAKHSLKSLAIPYAIGMVALPILYCVCFNEFGIGYKIAIPIATSAIYGMVIYEIQKTVRKYLNLKKIDKNWCYAMESLLEHQNKLNQEQSK